MSIHVLAKKSRALRGNSHNKNFAKFVTGERNRMGGCCRATNIPGPGQRRGLRMDQYRCCPLSAGPSTTVQGGVVRPKVPITQMSYGIYLKSRQGRSTGSKGPGLLAGRLVGNYVSVKAQNSSSYLEKKKVNVLKLPACCPKDRTVQIDGGGNIVSGPSTFVEGCSYIFKWTQGTITEIYGMKVDNLSQVEIPICGQCTNQLIIKGATLRYYKIVTSPDRCSARCGSKSCSCTKTFQHTKLEGGKESRKGDCCGRVGSLKKQRPAYVRGNTTCCVTTKDLTCESSGDYITRLKGKQACFCNDPKLKRICGGGCS